MAARTFKLGARRAATLRPYAVAMRLPNGQMLAYTALAVDTASAIVNAIETHGIARISAKPEKI